MTHSIPLSQSAPTASPADRRHPGEFAFTDSDFKRIAELAADEFGLHLQASKKSLIYSRLTRRLRDLRLGSFSDYLELVTGPRGETERDVMISALTTNVTHFYREEHHFAQLENDVLPALTERARAGGRVRIWSAGCSSGQEPYSIAASLLALCPEAGRLDVRILATDIDPQILDRAISGRYPMEERGQLTKQRADALFSPSRNGHLDVRPEVQQLVAFNRLNLMHDWPMRRPFDVIFCRNVAIYFDKPVQERLWARFGDALVPQGTLFIGHSERLSGRALSQFVSNGITAYQKLAAEGTTPPPSNRRTRT